MYLLLINISKSSNLAIHRPYELIKNRSKHLHQLFKAVSSKNLIKDIKIYQGH